MSSLNETGCPEGGAPAGTGRDGAAAREGIGGGPTGDGIDIAGADAASPDERGSSDGAGAVDATAGERGGDGRAGTMSKGDGPADRD